MAWRRLSASEISLSWYDSMILRILGQYADKVVSGNDTASIVKHAHSGSVGKPKSDLHDAGSS